MGGQGAGEPGKLRFPGRGLPRGAAPEHSRRKRVCGRPRQRPNGLRQVTTENGAAEVGDGWASEGFPRPGAEPGFQVLQCLYVRADGPLCDPHPRTVGSCCESAEPGRRSGPQDHLFWSLDAPSYSDTLCTPG